MFKLIKTYWKWVNTHFSKNKQVKPLKLFDIWSYNFTALYMCKF